MEGQSRGSKVQSHSGDKTSLSEESCMLAGAAGIFGCREALLVFVCSRRGFTSPLAQSGGPERYQTWRSRSWICFCYLDFSPHLSGV